MPENTLPLNPETIEESPLSIVISADNSRIESVAVQLQNGGRTVAVTKDRLAYQWMTSFDFNIVPDGPVVIDLNVGVLLNINKRHTVLSDLNVFTVADDRFRVAIWGSGRRPYTVPSRYPNRSVVRHQSSTLISRLVMRLASKSL